MSYTSRKEKDKDAVKAVKKKFNITTVVVFFVGLFFIALGVYHYKIWGFALMQQGRSQLPSLNAGELKMFIGLIFVGLGAYRVLKRKKLIGQVLELKAMERKARKKDWQNLNKNKD